MRQKWPVLRWALLTSLLSTGLGVFVNLATDLKNSWLAWAGVVVLMILTAVVSVLVQNVAANRATSTEGALPAAGGTANTMSGTVRGVVVQSQQVGDVHVHQAGRRTFLAEVVVVAVAAVVITAVNRDNGGAEPSSADPTPLSSSARAPASTAPVQETGPLEVTASWPLTRGCDGGTTVAMVNGGPDLKAFALDGHERERMIAAGGAVWSNGTLYLDLTTKPGASVRILNLRPLIDKTRLPPPTWIYSPQGGCGGPTNRHFALDLDTPSLTDKGVDEVEPGADVPKMRDEPIGPAFQVSADDPATLRFDVTGCEANYQWSLEVTYSVAGDDSDPHTYVSGPYRSMGFADHTKMYTLGANNSYASAGVVNGPSHDGWCSSR